LKGYQQASNGHCNVPQREEGGLGCWLHTQRTNYRQGVLGAQRQTLLEAISGMQWSVRDAVWEERLVEMKLYQASNDHCNVPRHEEGGLGKWLKKQRDQHGKGTLTPERQTKLETLGVRLHKVRRGATA
jgi:hypothetical protein